MTQFQNDVGDVREVPAVCVGAQPAVCRDRWTRQEVAGYVLQFEGEGLPDGRAQKILWMNHYAVATGAWKSTLTRLGFDPNGRSPEEWSRIGEFIKGTPVVLVMTVEGGVEKVRFINFPKDHQYGPFGNARVADPWRVASTAAAFFGGTKE